MRSSVAASSHCRSSRKSASGCSGRAKTPMKRRIVSWNRLCACCGSSSGAGRQLADDELEFRGEVDDEPPVRAQRLLKSLAPPRQLRLALGKKLPHKRAEGVRLASNRGRRASTGRICPKQRRRAPGRVPCAPSFTTDDLPTRNSPTPERAPAGPASNYAIESCEQGFDLAFAPV